MKIRELIINPDDFFQEVGAKPYNYYVPVIAVFLNTIVTIIATIYRENIPSELIMITIIIVISIIVFLISMLMYAIITYIILHFMNLNNLSFKKIIEIISYGYIISTFGDILITILNYLNGSLIPQWLNYLICIIFGIWACLIWAKGIQYTYSLKFSKALIPAAFVGVISLIIYIVG